MRRCRRSSAPSRTPRMATAEPVALAPEIAHHAGLDQRMERAVRGIRLLASVSWPLELQQSFLADWRAGKQRLPLVQYVKEDHAATRAELEAICGEADGAHPLGDYVMRTARRWIVATELLESIGTPELMQHSIRLFGRPGDLLPGGGTSNVAAARHFIELADELDAELHVVEADYCISAEILQVELQASLDAFFTHHKVTVELDPHLIAKAAAGPTRIRLRSETGFSEYDRHQLLEHEAFVHT